MQFAKDLLYTCYQMYHQMPAKLSPEIVYFNQGDGNDDIIVKVTNYAVSMMIFTASFSLPTRTIYLDQRLWSLCLFSTD